MSKRSSILFAVLLVLLAVLNLVYGGPQSMNVWQFFDYMRTEDI